MGFLETLEARTDITDEAKALLRAEFSGEVDPLRNEVGTLRTNDRREKVTTQIAELADAGFKDAPRALAFVRRLYLSPDSDEPGVVLFADHELGLSGEEATGSHSREEMSVKKAFETFFSYLPRDDDGKLKIQLSSQGSVVEDHGRPAGGNTKEDAETKTAEHKSSLGAAIGVDIGRPSRNKRYKGFTSGGGD